MTPLEALDARLAAGSPFSEDDAALLLASPDLVSIGMIADAARRKIHGPRTTFLRVFEVHVGAPPRSFPNGLAAGEIRIVGRPESADAAVAAVRALAPLSTGIPLSGFSLADLHQIAGESRVPLGSLCARLKDAGLEMIAEAPIDLLEDPTASVDAARSAGLAVLRLTVDALSAEARIPVVARASALQASAGGIKAFAPLPRRSAVTAPSTGYDDVKQIALARLLASNIPSIQVDWPLYGPKLAQVALTMGADDVDGVEAIDPGVLGPRRSPLEEIRGNIRTATLEEAERNGRFEYR